MFFRANINAGMEAPNYDDMLICKYAIKVILE